MHIPVKVAALKAQYNHAFVVQPHVPIKKHSGAAVFSTVATVAKATEAQIK
jgi:hypothetical protein